jgi:hypothetical protein
MGHQLLFLVVLAEGKSVGYDVWRIKQVHVMTQVRDQCGG